MEWPKAVAYIVGAVLSAAGLWKFGEAILSAIVGRGGRRVDAVERLTDSALELVAAVKADAESARHEVAEARRELADTRRELGTVRKEAEALAGRLATLIRLIHDPYMTIDRLRVMVPADAVNSQPGSNPGGQSGT